MKKPYKIVKSELFKQQEKKLPKGVKKELKKALEKIAKNPTGTWNTMSLFTPPSPKELKQRMGRVRAETIDLVFEYLSDKDCLNKKGRKLAHNFWKEYIKE